jgi:hypothetical protein
MKLDRTNQLLLATVVVLGGIAALRFYDSLRPAEALWHVAPFQPQAVTGIEYRTPEGTLTLTRADSGWMMESPSRLSAEGDKVTTFLKDWGEGFSPDLRLDARPSKESLATFGLGDEVRSDLTITGTTGTITQLQLGAKIAGGSHYLQQPGDPSVYRGRVPGVFRLAVDADAWRDKRLFPFAKDDLAALSIDGPKGAFEFARVETTERAWWTGVAPAGFEPSSRALDTLGRSLGNLKASRVVDDDEAASLRPQAGLETPRLSIVATTESGQRHTLRFGAEEQAGSTVWAAIDGDPRLFVLPKSVERQFDKGEDDLRDKTALHFRRNDQPQVTWTEGATRVVLEPEGQREWRVLEPAGFAADSRELGLAANSLLNLQAAELRFDAPLELPDDGPRIEVVTGDLTQVLRISAEPDASGGYLATVQGRAPVFVLRGAVVERLLRVFRQQPAE